MIDRTDILDTLGKVDMPGTADKVDTPDKPDRIDIVDRAGNLDIVDRVDLDLDTSVRKASVDPQYNPADTHTDMLGHTPVCTLAAEIHILVEIEADIDLEDTHQKADIDQQLEKVEDNHRISDILVLQALQ